MEHEHQPDWDPSSEETRCNQEAAYDEMRKRCPVAHSRQWGWSLFRHRDVMQVLLDHETFSNAVSQHLSVPNSMDPPEHSPYRRIIESYFTPARMNAFEPTCREIARDLVAGLSTRGQVEFINEIAIPFAASVQCAFLGWPDSLKPRLADWIQRNQKATLVQDRKALSEIAAEFELLIDELLEARRSSNGSPKDITAELMNENVCGRSLCNLEVASILRNWTAGEIGTISAAVGILVHFLADHPDIQRQLRADNNLLPYSIDEILRIHGPLATSRRVTTRPVEIGGRKLAAGERISLNWISANRDEEVFEDADKFRVGRDHSKILLYGAGIHVCPGAPLARLELRVFMEELFTATSDISAVPEKAPRFAVYPGTGFAYLPLRFAERSRRRAAQSLRGFEEELV